MSTHSKIGASSMYRWSACPGSVRLCEGLPEKTSDYAAEGITAHDLAAKWLTTGVAPEFPHQEMRAAVQVYVEFVRSRIEPGDTWLVENQFDLSRIHPGCFGTADCVIWKPAQQRLIVIDYKHGAGIAVEVENNPQLFYYGLGALLETKYPAKIVELAIVQPRCEHAGEPIRTCEIDALDLIDFSADLKDFAVATENPYASLVPGKHCHFCKAAALCPALGEKAQDMAKLEFGGGLSYDPQQLKLALDSRDAIKAWLKALDEFAYAEAEAGRMPPTYKLVAKRATRKWRSEGEVIEFLQDLGVKNEVLFEAPAIKSPTQLEKCIDKKFLEEFIVKDSTGHVLVPESDKRPAVKPSAQEEFTATA